MKIWEHLNEIPAGETSVVTIGNFDGVHLGHRKVIGTCVEHARQSDVDAVAITFDPHPTAVHRPEDSALLITSVDNRLAMLAATGLDATLVAPYDEDLYTLTPQQFAKQYLADGLGATEVVVGADFRFGSGNEGDVDALRKLGETYGFTVTAVSDVAGEDGNRWSSSAVRELLKEGRVDQAAEILGHPYRVSGRVQHGAKRGRKMGFPTANLHGGPEVLAPADGVYAGWLVRDLPDQTAAQEFLPAAISVGSNPQFDGTQRTIEAHALGRSDLDLYGEEVFILFTKRLRPMKAFENVEALKTQMDEDLRQVAEVLGARVAGRVDPQAVQAGLTEASSALDVDSRLK